MQPSLSRAVGLAAWVSILGLLNAAEAPAPGFVDFGKFEAPASGGEFVEVQVKSNLIELVAKLTEKCEPQVAEALRGLQQVRVNVIGMDDQNRADVQQRIKQVRGELEAKGWEKVVTAQQKHEDVGVYLKLRGSEAIEGLVVTVLDGKHEAVLVNVVGDIRPEKLAMVGERLNIEPLKKAGEALKKP